MHTGAFMKNLILLFISTLLLVACTKEEQRICTIHGHDCSEVVSVLSNTKSIQMTKEEWEQYLAKLAAEQPDFVMPDVVGPSAMEAFLKRTIRHRYENPQLQKMGLTIIDSQRFFDGGSASYTFSNGITVFKKWDTSRGGWKYITITFPTGETFTSKGKKFVAPKK